MDEELYDMCVDVVNEVKRGGLYVTSCEYITKRDYCKDPHIIITVYGQRNGNSCKEVYVIHYKRQLRKAIALLKRLL